MKIEFESLEEIEHVLKNSPHSTAIYQAFDGFPEWYWDYEKLFQAARNTCQKCLKRDRLERQNYERIWGDADLVCTRCNHKVRGMDFG